MKIETKMTSNVLGVIYLVMKIEIEQPIHFLMHEAAVYFYFKIRL